ncbi:MAG: hypothetical protein ACOC5U_02425 [Candidatus Aminicenantaceae bacterium]
MKLREIKDILKAELIWGESHLDDAIQSAGGSDLMSDVLAMGQPGILLLTGLTNSQSVRTADIIEAKAIVYVRGKRPDAAGIKLAREMDIPLLTTKFMMFTACGLLWQHHLPAVDGMSSKKQ